MNTFHALALGGVVPILASSAALAQNGNMMNGGNWGGGWMGGYSGLWMPILLIVVVVGVVLMVMKRK